MTRTGALMGTPHYMAPEQATGSSGIDARTDIYAIGIILYESVTGRVPFEAESFNQLLFEIALAKIAPARQLIPDLDPAIDTIILKATARDPAHRFQNCAEFLAAIEAWERTGAAVQLPPDQSIESIMASAVPRTGAHAVASPKTTPSAGLERAPSTNPGTGTAPAQSQNLQPDRASGSVSPVSPSTVHAEAPRRPTQSSWSNSHFEPKVPKNSAPIVVATLFGVALLASGAAAGYWYFSHGDTPAAQPPGVPSAPLANTSAEPKAAPAVSAPPEPSSAVAVAAPKVETPSAPVVTIDDTATAGVVAKPPTTKAGSRPPPPREPKSEKTPPKPKGINFGY
jgi:serine/threonine-protein kinase